MLPVALGGMIRAAGESEKFTVISTRLAQPRAVVAIERVLAHTEVGGT